MYQGTSTPSRKRAERAGEEIAIHQEVMSNFAEGRMNHRWNASHLIAALSPELSRHYLAEMNAEIQGSTIETPLHLHATTTAAFCPKCSTLLLPNVSTTRTLARKTTMTRHVTNITTGGSGPSSSTTTTTTLCTTCLMCKALHTKKVPKSSRRRKALSTSLHTVALSSNMQTPARLSSSTTTSLSLASSLSLSSPTPTANTPRSAYTTPRFSTQQKAASHNHRFGLPSPHNNNSKNTLNKTTSRHNTTPSMNINTNTKTTNTTTKNTKTNANPNKNISKLKGNGNNNGNNSDNGNNNSNSNSNGNSGSSGHLSQPNTPTPNSSSASKRKKKKQKLHKSQVEEPAALSLSDFLSSL